MGGKERTACDIDSKRKGERWSNFVGFRLSSLKEAKEATSSGKQQFLCSVVHLIENDGGRKKRSKRQSLHATNNTAGGTFNPSVMQIGEKREILFPSPTFNIPMLFVCLFFVFGFNDLPFDDHSLFLLLLSCAERTRACEEGKTTFTKIAFLAREKRRPNHPSQL